MRSNSYLVRLSVSKKMASSIDFSGIHHGIIRIAAPKSMTVKKSEKTYCGYGTDLKLECYVNGNESVGLTFLAADLIKASKRRVELRGDYGIKEPIRGSIDRLNFSLINTLDDPYKIKKGDPLLFLRFVSREYWEIMMLDKSHGLQSENVEIEVYVDGVFKPWNEGQALSRGLEEASGQSSKAFWEKDFIQVIDENGNDISK